MAVSFIREDGGIQSVELNGMAFHQEAAHKKISLKHLMNTKFKTQAHLPSVFTQMCVSAGLRFKANDETGIPAANLLEIMNPSFDAAGSFHSQPNVPDSRILFPSAIMEVMEDKLQGKQNAATAAFESLVGYRKSIATNKFETPVLSYATPGGPEAVQFEGISQNTRPALMLSLTASQHDRYVPTTSIGMEMSQEALASNSLDYIGLTLARFYKMADYNEWCTQLGLILSGDSDAAVTTFSKGTSALSSVTAASYDSAVVAAGTISQKAYLKYLYANSMSMTKSHLIMDFDAALAMDNRTGRPTNVQNNSLDRLDIPFEIVYPDFQEKLKIVVMPTGKWTANTIMGMDQASPALAKVTSTSADYSAIEDVVMKRSTELRIDRGFMCYRMWDAAYNVMTLTV